MTAGDVFQPSHGVTKCPVRAQHPSPDTPLPCAAPGRTSAALGPAGASLARGVPMGQLLTPGQPLPTAPAADPQSGNCGVNGMLMSQELGEIAPACGGVKPSWGQ